MGGRGQGLLKEQWRQVGDSSSAFRLVGSRQPNSHVRHRKMLRQMLAVRWEQPAHAFPLRDEAFQNGPRDGVQIVEVYDRFRQCNWVRSNREEIPPVNHSATDLISDRRSFQNAALHQKFGGVKKSDQNLGRLRLGKVASLG